ncbi:MAG: TrmH family RNA methyltransferase [Pseudomonadota bacterium]
MRGYFAIGVEGLSKPMNAGNLMRSAHAFGAAFFFVVDPHPRVRDMASDTSKSMASIPVYFHDTLDDLAMPRKAQMIGVELTDEAVDLPTFRHPTSAIYLLGSERTSLSRAAIARCNHVVKIPTAFCVNVATAGAIVMYDRLWVVGGFPDRGVFPGAPVEKPKDHIHGLPKARRLRERAENEKSDS